MQYLTTIAILKFVGGVCGNVLDKLRFNIKCRRFVELVRPDNGYCFIGLNLFGIIQMCSYAYLRFTGFTLYNHVSCYRFG